MEVSPIFSSPLIAINGTGCSWRICFDGLGWKRNIFDGRRTERNQHWIIASSRYLNTENISRLFKTQNHQGTRIHLFYINFYLLTYLDAPDRIFAFSKFYILSPRPPPPRHKPRWYMDRCLHRCRVRPPFSPSDWLLCLWREEIKSASPPRTPPPSSFSLYSWKLSEPIISIKGSRPRRSP